MGLGGKLLDFSLCHTLIYNNLDHPTPTQHASHKKIYQYTVNIVLSLQFSCIFSVNYVLFNQTDALLMSKNKPWNLEIYRGFSGSFNEDQLLINNPIRDFLENDDKFILVGGKGLGKTLFLRYKSHLYYNRYGESILFNTSQSELTENLNIHADTFSKEALLQFREEVIWSLLWELALWILLFRMVGEPLNPRLEKLVNGARQISNIMASLLNNRSKIEQYKGFVAEFQEQKGKIHRGVALFIDDVDQTIQQLLEEPHPSDLYINGHQNPSVEVWVNAQMGLVRAIYLLNRQNAHIKIYATIRREAFEAYEGEMKINFRHFISRLEYSGKEIKEIFLKNIEMTDPAHLINPQAHTLVGRFIGFDTMPHSFAITSEGERRKEDVLNCICRHTYCRPREIVYMGQVIDDLVQSHEYREAEQQERYNLLRSTINKVSGELLEQYRQEIIPHLDDQKLQDFVNAVRSNVIVGEEFRLFDLSQLQLYFNLGLLGYVKQVNHEGTLRQVFNPPATYNYRKFQPMPNTNFLLLHSTMDYLLVKQHTYGHFYNQHNIIGDGYEFHPKVDNHIHDLTFYLPREVSGNRFKANNESSGHSFPLESIYTNFFSFENAISRYERFMTDWNNADKLLGLLARVCYFNRLEKQFKTKFYLPMIEEAYKDMSQCNYRRQYNIEIPDASSDVALYRFMDKLMGRYITLGCYLVLDLKVEWIHSLLRQGRFDFDEPQDEDKKDTPFSYLSRSFFIRDLQRQEPRDPKDPQHRHLKQRIFDNLSPLEQKSLSVFIQNIIDEVPYLALLENEEHKTWLRSNVLQRIWRPQ
jgi:hypothetical protein